MDNNKDEKKKKKSFSISEPYTVRQNLGLDMDNTDLTITPSMHACFDPDHYLFDGSKCLASCVTDTYIVNKDLYQNPQAISGINYEIPSILYWLNPSSTSITPPPSPLSKEETEKLIAKYDAEHKNHQDESNKKLNSIAEEVSAIEKKLEKMVSEQASVQIKELVKLEVDKYFVKRNIEVENRSYATNRAIFIESIDYKRPIKGKNGLKKGNVVFNKDTGRIFYKGKPLIQLSPGQLHYKFIGCLFDCAGCAISYSMLKKTILGENQDKRGKNDDNYCHTIKSEIKRKSKKLASLIEKFPTGNGEKGYRLNCA